MVCEGVSLMGWCVRVWYVFGRCVDTFEAELANLTLDKVTVFLLQSKVLFYLHHCIRLGTGGMEKSGAKVLSTHMAPSHKQKNHRLRHSSCLPQGW